MTQSQPRALPYLLVALVAAVIHLQTIGFPFVFDDEWLIVRNVSLHEDWSALTAFARHFWHGTPSGTGYYRPIVTASLALNGRLLGWGPAGFHLVNVLLHAANAALLLALLRRLRVGATAAVLAALFFAVHPVAAWPVGSIVARVDLLPTFFLLLAALALAGGRAVAMGGCFLAALLCKESALAFLGVPILALRCGQNGDPATADDATAKRKSVVACVVAAIAAVGVSLAIRFAAGVPLRPPQSEINPVVNPLSQMPQPGRLLAAIVLAGRYLSYLFVPIRFADPAGYGEAVVPPAWSSPAVLVAGGLLALWALAALVLWARRDRAGLALAFALAAFLPASNLIVPVGSLYAQNFLYLPLAGMAVAAGDLLDRALGRAGVAGRRALVATAVVLLAVLAIGAAREVRVWSSEEAVFGTFVERFPRYPLGWSRLGIVRIDQGDPHGGEEILRKALAIEERNGEAHYDLGVALLATAAPGDRERIEEALEHSRRAYALLPDMFEAHVNSSMALLMLDRPAEAEAEARQTLAFDPSVVQARINLGEALFRQQRYTEALEVLRVLAREYPADPNVRSPMVVSLINANLLDEAREAAEAARRDFPDLAWFDFCLARVAARSGRRDEAIDLLRRAREREPKTVEWFHKVADFAGYREP
jgi:tetratricopeptide (TPR) repeat protein